MANYLQVGNRWTAIYMRKPQAGGFDFYEKVPYELVRFNVDTDPSARPYIVPDGENVVNRTGDKPDTNKVYEQVWITDTAPWRPGAGGKVYFGGVE